MGGNIVGEAVVCVTGSSDGLGRSLCKELLKDDFFVVGIARRSSSFSENRFYQITADLSTASGLGNGYEKLLEVLYRANLREICLVNNAANVYPAGFYSKLDPDNLINTFALNVASPMWLAQKILLSFPRTSVRIINISSGAANHAIPGWAPYCSSKSALEMASKVIFAELEIYNRIAEAEIINYDPGVLNTDMQEKIRLLTAEEFPSISYFKQLEQDGRLNEPHVVAKHLKDIISSKMSSNKFINLRFKEI